MSSLATVEELRVHLGLADGSAEIPRLQQFLDGAEAGADRYCGRTLAAASYVEYYSGDGTPVLLLRQGPVTAVAEVRQDQAGYWGQGATAFADASSVLTAGTDYALVQEGGAAAASALRRVGTAGGAGLGTMWAGSWYAAGGTLVQPLVGPVWPPGQGNVKVTYTAGYTKAAAPKDLKLALFQWAALVRLTAQRGGLLVQSASLGEQAYSLMQPGAVRSADGAALVGSVEQLLTSYARRTL